MSRKTREDQIVPKGGSFDPNLWKYEDNGQGGIHRSPKEPAKHISTEDYFVSRSLIEQINRSQWRAYLSEDEMSVTTCFNEPQYHVVIYPSEIIKKECGNCGYAQCVGGQSEPGKTVLDLECHDLPPDSGGWAKVKPTDAACDDFTISKAAYAAAKARLEQVKADLLQ